MECEKEILCKNSREFVNKSSRICEPCHKSCEKCFGPRESNCFECPSSKTLYISPNSVFSSSDDYSHLTSFIQSQDSGSYQKIASFLGDSINISCIICPKTNYFFDSDMKLCKKCMENCRTCRIESICDDCDDGYILVPGLTSCQVETKFSLSPAPEISTDSMFFLRFSDPFPEYMRFILRDFQKKRIFHEVSIFNDLNPHQKLEYSLEEPFENTLLLNMSQNQIISPQTKIILKLKIKQENIPGSLYKFEPQEFAFQSKGFHRCGPNFEWHESKPFCF